MTPCLLRLLAISIPSKEALWQDRHYHVQLHCCKQAAQLRGCWRQQAQRHLWEQRRGLPQLYMLWQRSAAGKQRAPIRCTLLTC